MVEPLEEQEDVIEVEDIMPFVFWWENRGKDNNGPDVNCYGKDSNAKLNYEKGGWCYSSAQQRVEDVVAIGTNGHAIHSDGEVISEQRWHAVQHTLGTDFSKPEYGGTVLSTDNSGNVFKGAFDPNCAGTDEKWKIHNVGNAFGADQSLDPKEDKYWKGEETHGGGQFNVKVSPTTLNEPILESIQDRPMTWNLWNVVRHYVYIKWFKNKYRTLGNDAAMWNELEQRTQKLVKGIYRTYQQTKNKYTEAQFNFGTIDESSNNVGNACLIRWTNSFVQISSILERNAREHEASFVLFTGNNDSSDSIRDVVKQNYESIRNHQDNFVVTTLDGIDSDELGMRPDDGQADTSEHHVYHGHTNADLPISYLIGENTTYRQNLGDVDISIPGTLSIDDEYPFCEYYKDDTTKKWVRNIRKVVMNRQILPVYTNMETMKLGVHDVTTEDLKKITFQVIPQFYWKYNWSYNEFMIHPVGKLEAPSGVIPMYDMLGNVWEWVRDDWTEKVKTSFDGKINPIATGSDHSKKVIRGGAFDQLVRKVISPSREGLTWNQFKSKFGTQANVGFRPAMVYTEELGVSGGGNGWEDGTTPVDLFFLFDASSTQDNQISEMVESARKIVRMFATRIENEADIPRGSNPVTYTSNQGCFVGSALFLGPQIRLMCSNLLGSATLKQFVTKPRVTTNGKQWSGWGTDDKSYADSKNSAYNRERADKENNPNYVLDDLKSNVPYREAFDGADFFGNVTRQSPRLADMTNKFKSKWKSQKNAYLEACEAEQGPKSTAPMLRSPGIADPGSPGGSGPGGSYKYSYHEYEYVDDHAFWHSGVPVYKYGPEGNEDLIFGKLLSDSYLTANGTRMSDFTLRCQHNFFTYNPTSKGVDTFEVPFIQSDKGVLCNWFGGCESISEVLATLLDDGFFYGFPWTPAIGYTFRKKEIPKLVFVFTNEFDNELCRQDESANWTHSLVAVPGLENETVQFNPARVGFTGIFSDGWKENLSAFDPYCVSWLNPDGMSYPDFYSHWKNYIVDIAGVGNAEIGNTTEFALKYDPLLPKMFALGLWRPDGWKLQIGDDIQTANAYDGGMPLYMSYIYYTKVDKSLCRHMSPLGSAPKLTSFKKVVTYLSRVQSSWDLRRRSESEVIPTTGSESGLRKILTDEQVDQMKAGNGGNILGVSGNRLTRYLDCKYTNTLGFYHLRNVVSKWDSPMAAYLFTSDGSFQNDIQ